MSENTETKQYPQQEGIWTLVAPDGRTWTGTSSLRCVAAEQAERIPAAVRLARIMRELRQDNTTLGDSDE